jgi:NAD-dependent SIR2 family protein deacetylase
MIPLDEPSRAATRELAAELGRRERWFILTGAGVSTDSGIPAYRDAHGAWQHKPPIQYADFVRSEAVRQRYWARSFVGYERIERAQPNVAHLALARLQALGRAPVIVTQNVDGLHQKAGSSGVIDLHGRLAQVECLACGSASPRAALQARLARDNPGLESAVASAITPDGDAEVDDETCKRLIVPDCPSCGGVLKPAVVFFGESVPQQRTASGYDALDAADAMLVVGSSLQVFSGHRFVRRAAASGKPIVVVNRGVTRADPLAHLKLDGSCGTLLAGALAVISGAP